MTRVAVRSLDEAIAEYVTDGATVAFEGFSHLIPFAAAHETIRQRRKNLTLVRMTPDLIYDQMIGMGCAQRVVFSYAGNPGVGLLRRLRDAVENAWPNTVEICEHSHAAFANAYVAAASGLPLMIFRGYSGVDLPKFNSDIGKVTCPFSGEELAAVRAINPDVTIIHAQRADRSGNVLVEGIVGMQKEAVLAARHAVVTVEEIVDDLEAHANACVLPHWILDALCVVPGGAHPSYAQGYYRRDNVAYREWDRIAADRHRFQEWMKENVLDQDHTVFASRAIWSSKDGA